MTLVDGLLSLKTHKHVPLNKLNVDLAYRSKALTIGQRDKIILFAHQGVKPSFIAVKIIAEGPDFELIPCDITDIFHKDNILKIGGKTEIEFLIESLEKVECFWA